MDELSKFAICQVVRSLVNVLNERRNQDHDAGNDLLCNHEELRCYCQEREALISADTLLNELEGKNV